MHSAMWGWAQSDWFNKYHNQNHCILRQRSVDLKDSLKRQPINDRCTQKRITGYKIYTSELAMWDGFCAAKFGYKIG